jgi:hypothetical protein
VQIPSSFTFKLEA